MSYKGMSDLFKAAAIHWLDDYAQSMGAALAFYTMFSIAPFLLIVTAVAGLFFGEGAAKGEIFNQMQGLLGAQGAMAVQSLLSCQSAREELVKAKATAHGSANHATVELTRVARRSASGGRRCGSIPSACGDW